MGALFAMNFNLTLALCVIFIGCTEAYNCTNGLRANMKLYQCNACKGLTPGSSVETRTEKSQLTALLLQIFLGGFGAGFFYYGLTGLGAGIISLCLVACCCGIAVQAAAGGSGGGRGGGSSTKLEDDIENSDEFGTRLTPSNPPARALAVALAVALAWAGMAAAQLRHPALFFC